MSIFYSAMENGFFSTQIFGEPTISIIDPDFEWPMIDVPDTNAEPPMIDIPDPEFDGEGEPPMITVPDPDFTPPLISVRDPDVEPPMIDVPNPDCQLPEDAVAISEHYHQQLLAGQGSQRIEPDANGYPVLVDPPPISIDDLADQKRREINAASVEALAAVRNEYPDYEQLSWERQEREALEGGGPLIESIATARGLEIGELIERILEKSNLYQQAAGNVIGKRQALEDQIAAALENGDRSAIESITW